MCCMESSRRYQCGYTTVIVDSLASPRILLRRITRDFGIYRWVFLGNHNYTDPSLLSYNAFMLALFCRSVP